MTLTQPKQGRLSSGIQSTARAIFLILDVPARWLMDIGDTVIGNRGYFAIGSVAAAYFAVFGLIDAKATQEETHASVERSLFMTLVSSGNAASFVAAMKDFGPTGTMPATEHPSWFRFWEWGRTYQPNMGPMHEWAVWRLGLCDAKAKDCSTDVKVRIELIGANLNNADLHHADLHDADLMGAHLNGAKLHDADLGHANLSDTYLIGADLSSADMSDANLYNANLSGADLNDADMRTAKLDNQGQLDQACGRPSLPKGLHPPKPCPEAEQLGACPGH